MPDLFPWSPEHVGEEVLWAWSGFGEGLVQREGRNGPKFGEEGEIGTNCIEEVNTEIKCRSLTYCEYFGCKG